MRSPIAGSSCVYRILIKRTVSIFIRLTVQCISKTLKVERVEHFQWKCLDSTQILVSIGRIHERVSPPLSKNFSKTIYVLMFRDERIGFISTGSDERYNQRLQDINPCKIFCMPKILEVCATATESFIPQSVEPNALPRLQYIACHSRSLAI